MTCCLLVPEPALDKLFRRLDKIARTAGISIEILPGTTTLVKEHTVLRCARVQIGELPATSGYTLAATIEHLKDGNVIARAPSETLDLEAEWRSMPAHCEHCGKKRHRKETFLLRQYGIRLMQIGRNCLADFLQTNPARLVAQAEFVREIGGALGDDFWGGCSGYWQVAPVAYIACAVASIEKYGFVKSTEEGSTRTDADWLSRKPFGGDLSEWQSRQPTEEQIETAHAIVAWLMAQPENCSEYLWNLSRAVREEGVGKHAGLLASAPVAFFRHLGKENERKQAEKAAPFRPEGYAVEKHEVFKGEVELVRHYLASSDWGSVAICTFRAATGHELVWFAKGRAPHGDMQGMKFQIKGRCAAHEEYKGVKRAILKRVTWKPVEIS